jgi:hypothetical protein
MKSRGVRRGVWHRAAPSCDPRHIRIVGARGTYLGGADVIERATATVRWVGRRRPLAACEGTREGAGPPVRFGLTRT